MPTLGLDCQIILAHPDLNSNAGDGFMLADGTAVSAQRTATEVTPATGLAAAVYKEETKLFASIVCADNVPLPNGGRDARTRAQVYASLIAYLSKRSGLSVTTPVGVYSGLFCNSHLATESHYPGYSLVVCTFSNLNAAFVPADPVAYSSSFWVDAGSYAGAMNWGNSIWRTL
jgi:hypothetical protein